MGHVTRVTVLRLAVILAVIGATAGGASKRDIAARHYKAANQLYEDLKHVPPPELEMHQFELVAKRLLAVRVADATSGYSDDALLRLADVYRRMAHRFADPVHEERAAETYELLAKEYPHSKYRDQALESAARLRPEGGEPETPAPQGPASGSTPPVTAAESFEPAEWPRLALSPEVHDAGAAVAPPGWSESDESLGGGESSVSELRHGSYDDGTRIVVHVATARVLSYELQADPPALSLDIVGSAISGSLHDGQSFEIGDGLVAKVRLLQVRSPTTRVLVEARREITFDAFWLDSPGRLVVDVRATDQPRAARTLEGISPPMDPAVPQPRPATATAAGGLSLTRALGLKLGRILIDAGHGGHDTGSVGPKGLKEKDVVLDISQRLGKLVQDRLGMEVIHTRVSDVFVPLEDRPKIAKERGADLMVSIHCNSARSSAVRGIETYYLSLTEDDEARAVAARENASARGTVRDREQWISEITLLNDKVEESRDFATRLQKHLYEGLSKHSSRIRDRGVRKAPFVVLKGAGMPPAALVEVGFLTNGYDEALMAKASFRQEVAEHLLRGIADYAESLGVLTMSESGTDGTLNRD